MRNCEPFHQVDGQLLHDVAQDSLLLVERLLVGADESTQRRDFHSLQDCVFVSGQAAEVLKQELLREIPRWRS